MVKRFELFEKVINNLNENGALDNLILIGSWCQYAYKIYYNNAPQIPALRTMDIDFLIPRPIKIRKDVDINNLLKNLGFSELFSSQTGNIKYVHPDLEIDFLTPELGRGSSKPYPVKSLHISAQQLRYLHLLQQYVIQVSINKNMVTVPEPAAYVFHKFLICSRRISKSKRDKDIQAAVEIGEFLLTIDRERIKTTEIFNKLPKKWKKDLEKIIFQYSKKISRFLKTINLKSSEQ
ncbi:hypothetical protein KAH27_05095 [bacterium]|nr:hypothetical protein [bacterium]